MCCCYLLSKDDVNSFMLLDEKKSEMQFFIRVLGGDDQPDCTNPRAINEWRLEAFDGTANTTCQVVREHTLACVHTRAFVK